MKSGKLDNLFIAEIIPILLILLFVLYTKAMIEFSFSSLGKLVAIILIVGYTLFDVVYGLVMCMMIILFYQLDHTVEYMDNIINELEEEEEDEEEDEEEEEEDNSPDVLMEGMSSTQFQSKNCRNNQLYYKEYPIKTDMAQHVFPEINFKYEPCNPCDKNCNVSFANNKINTEAGLTLPKSSNNSFYDSWKDVFGISNDFMPAFGAVNSDAFSLFT